MVELEKGYDSLLDYCYDYDIDTVKSHVQDEASMIDLYNYSIVASRFLICFDFLKRESLKNFEKLIHRKLYWSEYIKIYFESEQQALNSIKEELFYLCNQGNARAISLYLSVTPPSKRDLNILQKMKEIIDKPVKTPEEWEAVANLHVFDKIKINNKEYSIKELGLISLLDFYDNCLKDSDFTKKVSLRKLIEESRFGYATAKAQLGYYIKAVNFGYVLNLSDYINSNISYRTAIAPANVLAEYSDGVLFTNRKFVKNLFYNVGPKPKKSWIEWEYYAYGTIYYNVVEKPNAKKIGLKMLKKVARMPLIKVDEINMADAQNSL